MSRRRSALLVATLGLLVAVAGCSSDVGNSGDQGYVDGKGVITLLPFGDRKETGDVTGETLEGEKVALSQFRGKVVVINVWGSWCGPCRSEADDLKKAAEELSAQGVVFLGINTRDTSRENALAFQDSHATPYSSIYDPGGKNLLAFRGTLAPNAIPSTVVIDVEGRVAASVIGEITSARTLIDLVTDVVGSKK